MERKLIIGYEATPQGEDALALGEELAEELGARRILWRTVLGSVSSAVARGGECPLLVIPRGAGLDPLGLTDTGVGQTAYASFVTGHALVADGGLVAQ